MDNLGADRNLLFGLLALQSGLIDQVQFVAGIQSWTLEKARPLADHLVERGVLDSGKRGEVEALVGLHLKQNGDSPSRSLAALSAVSDTTQSTLASLGDPELTLVIAGLSQTGTKHLSEQTIDLGSEATIGGLAGLNPEVTLGFDASSSSHLGTGAEYRSGFEPTIDIGADSSFGSSGLSGLDPEARTVMTLVALHESELGDGPAAFNGGDAEHRGRAGRYQLMGEIARGGMGSVLRGRDPDLGRDLALKVLLDRHCDRLDLVNRFLVEAQICGQLQHPGVVPVYDLGTLANHRPFFAMKLVKGKTLAELLEARSSPADDLPRFLSIFEAICQTMAYAHSRGVIHRDLKPANVMVGAFGEVQVMDWGLAKILPKDGPKKEVVARPDGDSIYSTVPVEDNTLESQAGSVMGTPAYMAPEQARGEHDAVDRRADVFALGSILCVILTGQPVFGGKGLMETLRAAERADTRESLARLEQSGVDEPLLALTRECIAAEPEDRPADAKVVAGRINSYMEGVQERLHEAELSRAAESARAKEAEAKASSERHARRLTAALAATVLLAGLLGGVGWRWVEAKRLERVREASGRVNASLQAATRLRGLAQGAVVGDLAPWQSAAGAVDKARVLAFAEPDVEPALKKQVEALQAEIVEERKQAEAAAQAADRDKKLLDRLLDIRSAEADDEGGWSTDAAYADAFRGVGLDLATISTEEAAKLIKARPPEVVTALAASLDDWAAIRRDRKKNRTGAAVLAALAGAADPDNWRLELRRAVALPDPAARLEALRRLAKTTPFDTLGAISLDLLGRALKDAGDPAGAEVVLRRAQQRYPGDVWINYDLGRTLERLARKEEAIRYYTAARSLRPDTAHELAHLMGGKGEGDEEIAIFEDLRRLRPSSGRHLGCLGRALANIGRSQEAVAALTAAEAANREAVRLRPDDASAHFSLGVALHVQGKFDQAKEEYLTAIRLQPDNASVHDNLSELLGKQGKFDEAVAEHRIAIRLQPDFANAHNTHGDLLFTLKQDPAAAATAFRKAIQLQPDNPTFHDNLGLALQEQGKLDEALAEYRTAIRLKPNSGGVRLGIGEILELQGKRDEAIAEYRAGIKVAPNFAEIHDSLAQALLKKPDRGEAARAEALEFARRAVALKPKEAGFHTTLAMAEYRSGHWAESIAAGEQAVAIAKSVDGSTGFYLSMALWRQDVKDRSRTFFDQAVDWTKKNAPKDAELHQLWREAAELLGQPVPDPLPVEKPALRTRRPAGLLCGTPPCRAHVNSPVTLSHQGSFTDWSVPYQYEGKMIRGPENRSATQSHLLMQAARSWMPRTDCTKVLWMTPDSGTGGRLLGVSTS